MPGADPHHRVSLQVGQLTGAFPLPHTLRRLDLDLPGRQSEYLRAVAEAALDGLLDGAAASAAMIC